MFQNMMRILRAIVQRADRMSLWLGSRGPPGAMGLRARGCRGLMGSEPMLAMDMEREGLGTRLPESVPRGPHGESREREDGGGP